MIENDILRNVFLEEERVPSTNELAKIFAINPATAAKGINLLVDEDILYKMLSIFDSGRKIYFGGSYPDVLINYYLNGLKINGKVICLNLMLFLGIIMKIIIGFNDCRK